MQRSYDQVRPLAAIEAEINSVMNNSECVFKGAISRPLAEASWFASEVAKAGAFLSLSPESETLDKAAWSMFERLRVAAETAPIHDADLSTWDEVGYVYYAFRGENPIDSLWRLADELEAVVPAVPLYASGLMRQASNVRGVLSRSETKAQEAVRRAVKREHRWWPLWSALSIVGLFFLYGERLTFFVASGFLVCVVVLWRALSSERRKAEISRRCAEIGWPLRGWPLRTNGP